MNEILTDTYDALRSEGISISQRQFSKNYLGKCFSYFGYIKSTNQPVSDKTLFELSSCLNREKHRYQADIGDAHTQSYKDILERRVELFGSLSRDVFRKIEERHIPHGKE